MGDGGGGESQLVSDRISVTGRWYSNGGLTDLCHNIVSETCINDYGEF
jgi:hypothetical protein